jgi:hypothetical protein
LDDPLVHKARIPQSKDVEGNIIPDPAALNIVNKAFFDFIENGSLLRFLHGSRYVKDEKGIIWAAPNTLALYRILHRNCRDAQEEKKKHYQKNP